MKQASRPITVLICAIGGEGGGVLMNWIVDAATLQGLPVQSTSVPGVAQRTGATTYYIEVFPVPLKELGEREPVLSLYPSVGDIDLLVASELIEAGRAMERGFVSPDRTTLIGSNHRVYSIAEKVVGADGRCDSDRVLKAISQMARKAILFDGESAACQSGSFLNAVLLGAVAGSGLLPIPFQIFADVICTEGKAVEANLAGFAKGLAYGRGEIAQTQASRGEVTSAQTRRPPRASNGIVRDLVDRVHREYPDATHPVVLEGVSRLIDYQNKAYAKLYLDRLDTVLASDSDARGGSRLTSETGRHLALWMSYEDAIRVAQLKTRPERFERMRTEVGAGPDQVVKVTDFLKPGFEELCSILPSFAARPLRQWAQKRSLTEKLAINLRVKSSSITGFLRLWVLTKLRLLRPIGYRFKEEQAIIEQWLDFTRRAAALDQRLALEVVQCACLIKGYGNTRERGIGYFRYITEQIVAPALARQISLDSAVENVEKLRRAALVNPEAKTLTPLSGSTGKTDQT